MLLARALLVTLILGILVAPLAAGAQQAAKVYRIGWLGNTPPPDPTVVRNLDAFLQGLREHGYVEGQNIAIEWRWAEGKFERFPHFAAEFVHLKVDVIVAIATPGALAAKNATGTIPIVMVAVVDPVGAGLIASLARPGGNITGLTLLAGLEMVGKQLELLKEAVPGVHRVAVLWNPTNPSNILQLRETEAATRVLGVQLQPLETRGPEEFDGAFATMARERAGALIVFADPMFYTHRTRLVDLAAKHRLPAMFFVREFSDAGGLMSYGVSLPDLLRRAAIYVDKILKGAKPADLPVEQPTRFELVINRASRES